MKTTVKEKLLTRLLQKFGNQDFTYTDIVKEVLIVNGIIDSYEEYSREYRGYYACALSPYPRTNDYLYNFSRRCPLRLVKTFNGKKNVYYVEKRASVNRADHDKVTVQVLKSIINKHGVAGVSESGHEFIKTYETKTVNADPKQVDIRKQILDILELGLNTDGKSVYSNETKTELLVELFNSIKL